MGKQNIVDTFKIDFLESYSQDDILKELQRVSKIINGRAITRQDIIKHGRVSYATIYKKFGGLSKAIMSARLKPNICHNVTDEELLGSLIDLWSLTLSKDGRRPERRDIKRYEIPFSGDTYYRRFGSWKKALIAAYDFAGKKEPTASEENQPTARNETSRRPDISIRRRFLVFRRDEFTCVICGRSGRGVRLEVDHKIPVSKDGGDDLDNLQTLCFECNRGKRDDFEPS